jgi:DNA-binding MarR family transcriptional regulator
MTTCAPELRIAVMRLARRLRAERTSDALTPSQLAVLGTLLRQGQMTPRELAEAERVQPPSMTRILNNLQAAGMVTRNPHPDDRRQVLYTVTELAREMVSDDRRRRDHWLSQRLAALAPDELSTLEAAVPLLDRLALD